MPMQYVSCSTTLKMYGMRTSLMCLLLLHSLHHARRALSVDSFSRCLLASSAALTFSDG